jgi:hypothetical protein
MECGTKIVPSAKSTPYLSSSALEEYGGNQNHRQNNLNIGKEGLHVDTILAYWGGFAREKKIEVKSKEAKKQESKD